MSGWANGAWGIAPNLRVVSFQATELAAESVVEILDPQGRPTLRVRHRYMPVPDNPFLYQALVTIENVSDNPIDARYRRVMDWDVEPTA